MWSAAWARNNEWKGLRGVGLAIKQSMVNGMEEGVSWRSTRGFSMIGKAITPRCYCHAYLMTWLVLDDCIMGAATNAPAKVWVLQGVFV